jgi:Tfp pilus assembly protein PilN
MIEINLLPQELKIKAKKKERQIKSRQILYFIPLLFIILLLVHGYLIGVLVFKNIQLTALNNKWQKLQPQVKTLEEFKEKYELVSQDSRVIQQLTSQRLNWAQKLNKLSFNLPSGVWFNEILVTAKDFILKASVVSLQKDEMNLINQFIERLKKDNEFFKDFSSLELNSVQKNVIGGYDVADFVLSGKLKPR